MSMIQSVSERFFSVLAAYPSNEGEVKKVVTALSDPSNFSLANVKMVFTQYLKTNNFATDDEVEAYLFALISTGLVALTKALDPGQKSSELGKLAGLWEAFIKGSSVIIVPRSNQTEVSTSGCMQQILEALVTLELDKLDNCDVEQLAPLKNVINILCALKSILKTTDLGTIVQTVETLVEEKNVWHEFVKGLSYSMRFINQLRSVKMSEMKNFTSEQIALYKKFEQLGDLLLAMFNAYEIVTTNVTFDDFGRVTAQLETIKERIKKCKKFEQVLQEFNVDIKKKSSKKAIVEKITASARTKLNKDELNVVRAQFETALLEQPNLKSEDKKVSGDIGSFVQAMHTFVNMCLTHAGLKSQEDRNVIIYAGFEYVLKFVQSTGSVTKALLDSENKLRFALTAKFSG